jgi:hypothetical protein
MLTFLDGPALGQTGIWVNRAPLFLRVVCNAAGEWDALDQVLDTLRPGEAVHAYRRVGGPMRVHVDAQRGKGRRSGWFAWAKYRLVEPQPALETMADNAAWQAWCREAAGPKREDIEP